MRHAIAKKTIAGSGKKRLPNRKKAADQLWNLMSLMSLRKMKTTLSKMNLVKTTTTTKMETLRKPNASNEKTQCEKVCTT
ncbi:hypothetical protein DVH05_009777 [Phytophthora capsici]|nr:hypothetical protein DVH05_009777 [Phytophthora capsici]